MFALKSFMTRILLGQLQLLPSQLVSQSVRPDRVRFAGLNAADGRGGGWIEELAGRTLAQPPFTLIGKTVVSKFA